MPRPHFVCVPVTAACAAVLAAGGLLTTALVAPTAAAAASTGLTISEVYGGGGNSGSTYTNDFIELYNPTGSDVDVASYAVQYATATGTSYQVTAERHHSRRAALSGAGGQGRRR